MQGELLFVYGTLRKGFGGPMSRWLARQARYCGSASIRGLLYDTGDYPAFIPTEDAADRVVGDLYTLIRPHSLLRKLDRFEGIGPGQRRPYEYRRVRLAVERDVEGAEAAWVYVYAWPVSRLKPVPGGDYLRYRRRGG